MQELSGHITHFYKDFCKLSELKRAFNEVNFSKGTKPGFPRVKKNILDLRDLDTYNWEQKTERSRVIQSNIVRNFQKDTASVLAHKENEMQVLSNGIVQLK